MSKKFKKFLLFAAASAAVSALVLLDKKRKEGDSLFEEDETDGNDMNENCKTDSGKETMFPVDKNVSLKNSSRSYINLV